jgi:O-antigen ligase
VFCVYTFILIGRPQDYVPALTSVRLAMVFTVITAVLTLLRGSIAKDVFRAKETRLYLLFYCALIAGIPFGVYRPGAFDVVITRYIVNVAFFLLFLVHVDSIAKLKRVALVLVFSVFVFTVFGLRGGNFVAGRYSTGSQIYDPNDVAFVEVSLLGFALWVLTGSFGLVAKVVAFLSVMFGVLLTLYTASRGGLLGLLTFLVLFLVLRTSKVSAFFKAFVVAALLVGATVNSDKINLDRYLTLTTLEDDYNFQEGGRVDIWNRGWRIFLGTPITGVGVAGFAKAIGDQRAEDKMPSARWQTAHSSYILVLTETGLLGTLPFLFLILRSLATFNRLRRASAGLAEKDFAALPGFLLVGFVAQLVSAAFLSQTYSTFFTLSFALSAVLNRIAANAATASLDGGNLPTPPEIGRASGGPGVRWRNPSLHQG